MRKKNSMPKLLAGALVTIMILGGLNGCGKENVEKQVKNEITVTFMNQDESLGTVKAVAGETLDKTSYEGYEKLDNAEFNGWFETPSFVEASKKDLLSDTFDKDTTLYGDFRSNSVAEDTRHWYIAGTSTKGVLQLNNWAGDLSDEEKLAFELTPTGSNINEYAIMRWTVRSLPGFKDYGNLKIYFFGLSVVFNGRLPFRRFRYCFEYNAVQFLAYASDDFYIFYVAVLAHCKTCHYYT